MAWPLHDIGNTNSNIVLNGKTGGSGGTQTLLNLDCKIQRGGNQGGVLCQHLYWFECIIPESTHEYLVKAKAWHARRMIPVGGK